MPADTVTTVRNRATAVPSPISHPVSRRGLAFRALAVAVLLLVYTSVQGQESSAWRLVSPDAHAGLVVENMQEFRDAVCTHSYLGGLVASLEGEALSPDMVEGFLSNLPVSENDAVSFLWDRAAPKLAPAIHELLERGAHPLQTTPAELYRTFDRALALYATEYDVVERRGRYQGEWNTVLSAAFTSAGHEKVEEFLHGVLDRLPEEAEWGRYEVHGVEIIQARYYEEARTQLPGARGRENLQVFQQSRGILEYAFVDGHLLLGKGRAGVLGPAVEWIAAPGENPRPEAGAYRTMLRQREPGADATFFLNQAAIHDPRRSGGPSVGAQNWPIALGLESAGPLLVSASIQPELLTLHVWQGGLGRSDGLLSLLTGAPDNTFEEAVRLVPGAPGFATVTFDLRRLWEEYMLTMRYVDRNQQRIAETVLHLVRSQLNVNIVTDFFPYYEGELVSYIAPAAEEGGRSRALFFLPGSPGTDRTPIFNRIISGLTGDISFFDLQEVEHRGVTLWETPPPSLAGAEGDRLVMAATSRGIIISDSRTETERVIDSMLDEEDAAPSPDFPPRLRQLLEEYRRPGVKGLGYVSGVLARPEFAAFLPEGDDAAPAHMAHLWWVVEATQDSVAFRFTMESESPAAP